MTRQGDPGEPAPGGIVAMLSRAGMFRAGAGILLLLAPGAAAAQPDAAPGVIADLRVHGNYSVPDAEVIQLAGVTVGDRLAPDTRETVAARLRASNRFEAVEVRTRYQSMTRTDQVALILVVRERPAALSGGVLGRALTAAARNTMFVPILGYAEGHGVTYGSRFTLVNALGERGRLSAPLTLGGTRQAALEFEKGFDTGAVHAIRGGVGAFRTKNQHYLVDDRQAAVWVGAHRELVDGLRIAARTQWSDVGFGQIDDQAATHRVAIRFDTRLNPGFPRDAVFVEAAWQWLDSAAVSAISQPQLDARAYVGLFGQSVLAIRAQYQGASAAVPAYAQPLLGGTETARGHRLGVQAGDRLAAASAELRLPWTGPMSIGKLGVRLFFDSAAVFGVDQRLRKTRFLQGAGAGLFFNVAFLNLQLDVGHDLHGGIRMHFQTSAGF